jgi:hypothetical protein
MEHMSFGVRHTLLYLALNFKFVQNFITTPSGLPGKNQRTIGDIDQNYHLWLIALHSKYGTNITRPRDSQLRHYI